MTIDIQGLQTRGAPLPAEYREAPEGSSSPGVLEGYAIRFNAESRDLGGFHEVISPDAVMRTADGEFDLAGNGRVMARLNHNSDLLLGATDSGTLSLSVDEEGLRYRVELPNTQAGRDAAELARRGDMAHSSFAFWVLPDGLSWSENTQGDLVATVRALRLVDVAPVSDPAYWQSSVEVTRSVDEIRAELEGSRAHKTPEVPPGPGEPEQAFRQWASLQTMKEA